MMLTAAPEVLRGGSLFPHFVIPIQITFVILMHLLYCNLYLTYV